jgi:hypothetical protein
MNTERDNAQDRLERLAATQLARLPELRAPASLEARVMAAIAAQSAPWYSRGFRHWPWWAKALFVLLAALLAYWLSGESVVVFNQAQSQLVAHGGATAADVGSWLNVLRALGQSMSTVAHVVPGSWALLATGIVFVCYATLVAGGVFAYRTISKV